MSSRSSRRPGQIAQEHGDDGVPNREAVFQVNDLAVAYSGNVAIRDVTLDVYRERRHGLHRPVRLRQEHVDPLLQPDERPDPGARRSRARSSTTAATSTRDDVDPVEVRRRIGMVFQKPNPFPKSIYDNVAFGPRVLGLKGDLDERVEQALQQAALWDEVKDRLKESALGLSGGQQQRLCIARCLAVEPDVILMDEPASALDPISTTRIEDLMHELKREYTIVIVTHNMQQAARVADMTAFFIVDVDAGRRQADGHPRRVRPDGEDLHDARRQADRGLRDGAVRLMRISFQEELDAARGGAARRRASSSCARCAAPSRRSARRTSSSPTR